MFQIHEFVNRIKFVKLKDIYAIIPMLFGLVMSVPYRIFHKNIWLICERADEARDNGYWFFKYLVENHKEIEAIYAIKRKSADYNKVSNLGKVIEFGSLMHWIVYFAAKRNISSQKEGKPNAAICFILEVYLGFRKNRAYIRHGIAKDKQKWVYYSLTKMNLFVCSAQREFDYIKKYFEYPEQNLKLLGLCRFDNLLRVHEVKRQIIVMPTMREWLRNISIDTEKFEGHREIRKSEYVTVWNSFLNNENLNHLLMKYNVELLFFPHSAMQKYIDYFTALSSNIHVLSSSDYDVQELLMESKMLITDYSSVYFDFAYMKKPLLYYQFDYKKYRKGQYEEGYFSYENDGFGKVTYSERDLLSEMERIICSDFKFEKIYCNRVDKFFKYTDSNNCERTYKAIMEMEC